MFKRSFILFLSIVMIFSFSITPAFAQSNTSNDMKTIDTVEAFTIDTLDRNDERRWVRTGYKNVESITSVKTNKDKIHVSVLSVEDYYDKTGYLYSLVKKSEFKNNYNSGEAKHKNLSQTYHKPQISKVLKKKFTGKEKDITKELEAEEKSLVKQNIVAKVSKLKDKNFENTKGFTHEDIKKIKEKSEEIKQSLIEKGIVNTSISNQQMVNTSLASSSSVESAGALDNYYNHDIVSGDFTVQALGDSAYQYVRWEGNASDGNNASSLIDFKENIDQYEYYIIEQMEYNEFWEVLSWASTILGFVTFAAGVVAGPVGWAGYALLTADALATFMSFTSSTYATYTRLSYSRNAAQYLANAQDDMYYTKWTNTTGSTHYLPK